MKQLLILTVFILLLVGIVNASTPVLENTISLGGDVGSQARMLEIDSTHLAILDRGLFTGICRLRIVNPSTGVITDSTTFVCSDTMDLDYEGGKLLACTTYFVGGSGTQHHLRVYGLEGDGFMTLKTNYGSGNNPASFFGGCQLESSSSTSADILVGSFFYGSIKNGLLKLYYNGSYTFTEYPDMVVPSSFNLLEDTTAQVFANGADFYNNSNPYNHSGQILDTVVGGDLIAWNKDSENPEYVTDEGFIVIADDYSSVIESTGNVTMNDIIVYANRDSIYGLIDGWWYQADFSDAGNPTLTNLSLLLNNYDASPSGFEFTTSTNRIYYLNETTDTLTVWNYDTNPECEVSDGCFIYDSFGYTDSLLNHGWEGWNTVPDDGEFYCFADARWNSYQFTPITSDTGTMTLEFDVTICGDSTAQLNMWLQDDTAQALKISFRGDADDGSIINYDGSIISDTLGVNVSDTGNLTCSGNKMFVNTYTVVFFMQNNPRSFDVYINGALAKENIPFTTEGLTMNQINKLYFGGGYAGTQCFWRIDNVYLYTDLPDYDDAAILEQQRQFGSFTLDPSEDFEFDFSLCRVGENHQICFLRVLLSDIFGGAWRTFVKYPLEFIAFIIIFLIIMIASKNKR